MTVVDTNVLALYLRKRLLTLDQACTVQNEAESLMADHEYHMDSVEVLGLAGTSGCAAYDCEFVALARFLGAPLVTMDKAILDSFPDYALSLHSAAQDRPD